MFLLRRTVARAISSTPSKTIFANPRSITTYTQTTSRSRQQQQWPISLFQRRFASDEATKTGEGVASESFAQTVAEAPSDDTITPVPEAPQAQPTDESATVGVDALAAASNGKTSTRRSAPRDAGPSPPSKTLYVGNLYYEVAEDQLKRVFSRFGDIASAKILYDNRGLSRGFGYIEFTDMESAQSAVENLNMQVFEGRNLVVQFHRPRPSTRGAASSKNSPSKTLFIGNMSFEMSDKDLNDLFRDIRNVIDVRVAIDRRTGQPRGFAHADFVDVASATKAKEVLKDKVIYGRQLRVDFGLSAAMQRRDGQGDARADDTV